MLNIAIFVLFFIFFLLIYLIYLINKFLINNQKNNYEDKFFDLQNKILDNFNKLKQETVSYLSLTLTKHEKIIESTSKIEELARNIEFNSGELRTLKEILSGPQNRGYLGEVMLEEIIKNLPLSFYEKQYPMGYERVDYVLKINNNIIPIDAKFPIANSLFKEDKDKQIIKKELIKNLKNKIDEISRKYILPAKGTVEFALMYLANEGIYYELLSDKDYLDVWNFAREKSVFITSPKNFELLCSSLLLIIRKQELGQNIQQVLVNLKQLEKDILELSQQFEKSHNQLKYSFNNLQEFEKILNRFIINFKSLIKSEQKLENKIKEI